MKEIFVRFTEKHSNEDSYEVTDEEYKRIMDGEDIIDVLGTEWFYEETSDTLDWYSDGMEIEVLSEDD